MFTKPHKDNTEQSDRPSPIGLFLLVGLYQIKDIAMLFCSKTISEVVVSPSTVDAGKILLGAGYRLPDVTG